MLIILLELKETGLFQLLDPWYIFEGAGSFTVFGLHEK